jgi:hypothetical protein
MNTITDKATLRGLLKDLGRPDERSPLFWWLLDHHDQIVESAAGRRMRWATLCAHFEALGLTDTKGKPPTPRNARETWFQVRREVARLRSKPTAPNNPRPARLPAGWHPTPIDAPAPVRPRAQAPPLGPTTAENTPEHVKERLEALERQFQHQRHPTKPPTRRD